MKKFREIFTAIAAIVTVLLLSSFMAYGDIWTANKNLSKNSGGNYMPVIAINGPKIYVVWNNNGDIYFKRSLDGGGIWSSGTWLTYTAADTMYPAIAVDGANIYVAWCDRTPGNWDIYFRQSADGGDTWKAIKQLTSNAGDSREPAIAVSGSNIYMVWSDSGDICFKRSIDRGATWSGDVWLTYGAVDTYEPAIAVNGSNIYVVWSDQKSEKRSIYFKRSVDSGISWTASKQVSNTATDARYPAIAVSGSNIYVVWEDNPQLYEESEIYFNGSVDGGTTWKNKKRLTNTAGESGASGLAVNGSDVYVVWSDRTPGDAEIYFKRSVNGGVTWTANKRLTYTTGISHFPAIAVSGSNIYVVWSDNQLGFNKTQIYYKKGVME